MLDEYRARILAAIEAKQGDKAFTLKMLLGDQWPQNKGHAVTLGTEFRQAVAEDFPQLEPLGVNGRNHELYRKR
jgi:hypothetical protein